MNMKMEMVMDMRRDMKTKIRINMPHEYLNENRADYGDGKT